MKVIALLMALVVLVCSCIPCKDGAFAISKTRTEAKILKAATQQEETGNDNCSPFCSCNCCSGFTYMFTTYQLIDKIDVSSKSESFHLPSKISDTALPVWQPPQLV